MQSAAETAFTTNRSRRSCLSFAWHAAVTFVNVYIMVGSTFRRVKQILTGNAASTNFEHTVSHQQYSVDSDLF
eukprot:scaffold75250_cov22-Prasinocladus_malaysianus.AAC.2